jgi:hypothetical protein
MKCRSCEVGVCAFSRRVKQGDPAGPLFFAVSTFDLFESIREAAEKLVVERFSQMPSSYVCDDDLQVAGDPQLAYPVTEMIQRKMVEAV